MLPDEVIVCDDGSEDGTPQVVSAFRAILPHEMAARLRYLRNTEPLGLGGNFDRAVRSSRTEFCVKLDSDDILDSQYVEILYQHLAKHPKAGWAHCNVYDVHPDGKQIGLAHARKQTGYCSAEDAIQPYLCRNDTCHCVLLRMSAYRAIGGYNPDMLALEDWRLWLEMLLQGWGYCYDQRPLARMRKHPIRPEVMSPRRMGFVAGMDLLVARVESLLSDSSVVARFRKRRLDTRGLRRALAGLCLSAYNDEHDVFVRRALFVAAMKVSTSLTNRVLLRIAFSLPKSVTLSAVNLLRWPRRMARLLWMRAAA
jgi:hypothetical protein